MKITIDIPDEELKERIMEQMVREITAEAWQSRHFLKECRETVKEMIYEPKLKAEIIDKAVNAAAHEIRRKGMPILANKMMEDLK